MKVTKVLAVGVLLSLVGGMAAAAETNKSNRVSGDYAEFRTADVYTGPCFANGEVGLSGDEAILAWRVREGSWEGVSLDGLSVMAVVRASATLGDPFADPLPARAVLIVDERASASQREALAEFARQQNRELLQQVVAVESAPIRFTTDEWGRHGYVTVEAGKLAKLSTRTIGEGDKICHNEEVYYPPLAGNLDHSMPVVAAESLYQGGHLGVSWKESGRRGSFVGTFSF